MVFDCLPFTVFRELPILCGTADGLGTSPLKPEDHVLPPPRPPGAWQSGTNMQLELGQSDAQIQASASGM